VLHKLMRKENLPDQRVVVFFQFREAPKRCYWLVLKRPEVDVCLFEPGFGIDLEVVAKLRALADICLGHLAVRDAMARGTLTLLGARDLCKAIPDLARYCSLRFRSGLARSQYWTECGKDFPQSRAGQVIISTSPRILC